MEKIENAPGQSYFEIPMPPRRGDDCLVHVSVIFQGPLDAVYGMVVSHNPSSLSCRISGVEIRSDKSKQQVIHPFEQDGNTWKWDGRIELATESVYPPKITVLNPLDIPQLELYVLTQVEVWKRNERTEWINQFGNVCPSDSVEDFSAEHEKKDE